MYDIVGLVGISSRCSEVGAVPAYRTGSETVWWTDLLPLPVELFVAAIARASGTCEF